MLTFTITCECGSTHVSVWHRFSRDGEEVGVVFKCRDCGASDGPY